MVALLWLMGRLLEWLLPVYHPVLRLRISIWLLGLMMSSLDAILDFCIHLCHRAREAEVGGQTIRASEINGQL